MKNAFSISVPTGFFRPGRRELATNGLAAVLIGLLYFLYRYYGVSDVGYFFNSSTASLFQWLRDRWMVDFHYNRFAFSHWVPLISLLLVWRDRRALRNLPHRWNPAGLVVVLFGFALHWAGLKSEQTRLSILSLIALSWGFPLFICGWPTAKRLAFPCAFLLFSIPLNFFDALAQPVRIASAALASGLLNGLGIETVRSGPYVASTQIDTLRINLGDAPGSVFAVIATGAFALLCAYLMRASWHRRLLVLVAAIPLLMAANILRATIAMLAGVLLSAQAGLHVQAHYATAIVATVTFGGLALLAWRLHLPGTTGFDTPPSPPPAAGYSPMAALLVSVAFTVLACWWIPAHSAVHHREEAGVNLEMPRELGPWKGGILLFCHNPEKPEQFFATDTAPGDPCPSCGQPLEVLDAYEKRLLPPDTLVRKNWYSRDGRDRVFLSTVLSGKNRSSIHRPEVCLVGDGSQISRTFTHGIPLEDGRTLKVKVLEMVHQFRDAQGAPRTATSYYAYWFAGIGRETPDHVQRMIWMASDRLFRSESYRWAYLSVGGARTSGSTNYLAEIDQFVRLAYPHLIRK